jgi:hemoglobin
MSTRDDAADLSLYKRLGGYDSIVAIVDDLFALMRADARFSRFAVGRSIDSRRRSQQLTVDLICSLSGGTCYYIGRDMRTSHAGLAITEVEWEALLELSRKALHNRGIGGRLQVEFLSLFERYKSEIVEAPNEPPAGAG